ncbi:NUDIX domain-containing protein [Helicobacter sp. T3_23-1056]
MSASYFITPPQATPLISDLRQGECKDSRFIKPLRLHYKQDNEEKKWDIIHSHDSVSILLYERDLEAFVIVKQFRPAVYMRNHNGYIYELCAGLVDKPKKSLEQIAVEEVFEECGYEIPTNRLQFVNSFYNSVGISGARQTVYLAEVSKEDKHALGGGTEGEKIEVLYLKASEALEFVRDEDYDKTPSLAFGINYFFYQYRPSTKRK